MNPGKTPEKNERFKSAFQITCGTMFLAIALGIAVDLATAHIATDYFLPPHRMRVLPTDAPLALALYWGFAASWWFGLIAGAILACVNLRRKEPLPTRIVLSMAAKACAAIWVAMMLILGGVYGLAGLIPVEERRQSFEFDRRMMAVAIAHLSEYVLGAITTFVIAIRAARRN